MRRALLLLCLSTAAATTAVAEWPQWRGPARDGVAPAHVREPQAWPAKLDLAWRRQVGLGHSSPVVSGDRVFLLTRQGEQETIAAYDLGSGTPLWQHKYDAPYTMNSAAMTHGKGPKSTPVVHRGTVCAFGIAGTLSCLDAAKGSLRWQHLFRDRFRTTSPLYGVAMSPAADGDLLLAHVGGPGDGAFTAFDIATGQPRWRWTGDGPAYASPLIVSIAGTRQVITQTERHIVGLSMSDGSLLWRLPFTTDYDQNAVTPVVVGSDVLVYSGLANGMTAARVRRDGNSWRLDQLWRNDSIPAYMSTPVVAGGVLFGFTHRNRGQLFAAALDTGKTLWTTRGREGENAALISMGGSILALTTEADLIVFRQSPAGYEEVRRYEVADSPTWAHPALSAAGILIKDETSLALWRLGR